MSDGETPEEALRNVQDAIKCWIETAKEKGRAIPLHDDNIKNEIEVIENENVPGTNRSDERR
jgi:predicted RNase H-like HicB family nuclease